MGRARTAFVVGRGRSSTLYLRGKSLPLNVTGIVRLRVGSMFDMNSGEFGKINGYLSVRLSLESRDPGPAHNTTWGKDSEFSQSLRTPFHSFRDCHIQGLRGYAPFSLDSNALMTHGCVLVA
jgi:hypothetical protein